jgi:hypothetical protein
MSYSITLTGDCSNNSNGAVNIQFYTTPPTIISWTDNKLPTQTFTGDSITYTGLSADTYSFSFTSSTVPVNRIYGPVSFEVLSATTANITTGYQSICSSSNGYLTVDVNLDTFDTELYPTPVNINLYKDYVLYETIVGSGSQTSFFNLGQGMYYASINGNGFCNCETESVVIHPNTESLDFNFYVVNNPACSGNSGKIYVTGLTGTPPYTYVWSQNVGYTGATTLVTGITQGTYSLTITDGAGCQLSKTAAVGSALFIGLVGYTLTQPTCFTSDGVLNVTISGGTAPYFYLLSNGDSITTYSESVSFSGLSAGLYTLTVTDVALCTYSSFFTLSTPKVFTFISADVINSQCQYNGGSIDVSLLGGTPPYYYTLDNNSGTTNNVTSLITTNTFSDLSSGTYTLTISDSSSACTYSQNYTVLNETSFNFSLSARSNYCTYNSGAIQVDVTPNTTASTFYTYSISSGFSSAPTTATTYVFNNLPPDTYNITISDSTGCTQNDSVVVNYLSPYNLVLYGTDCGTGSGGTISAMINETDGPFNLTWSDNVNGQTGVFITGLTAGTYYLAVSGVNNCETTKYFTISCNSPRTASSAYAYSMGTKSYIPSSFLNFSNMLSKGYLSLTNGHTACKLNYARFFCDIELGGVTYSGTFYTSKTITSVPTLSAFTTAVNYLLATIPDIKDYEINLTTNTINVESDVVGGVEVYKDEVLTITVRIVYKISCLT